MTGLQWTRVARGRKADQGHTTTHVAVSYEGSGRWERRHYRCQCGKEYSGIGNRATYTMEAHRRQALEGATA